MPELEIEQLIANSKANEAIALKLFEIETEVLASKSCDELLQRLLNSIKQKFNLSNIALLLVEPTPISYMFNEHMQTNWHKHKSQKISLNQLQAFHGNNKPFLTNELDKLPSTIPNDLILNAQSIALTPLILEGQLFGSLLFTDTDKARFSNELGTFHLEQLAAKVSLCLSNVLIREQLEYMAHYDRLTGVANRRLMEVCIAEELVRQHRYGVPFSLLFIDCDKFKLINDQHGHDCGDQVLAYVATKLQGLIRENDNCFRYAGDEFVVVLASQNFQEAELAAERLSQFFVKNPMPYQDISLPITITCGVSASDGKHSMTELLKEADRHLYQQKNMRQSALV
ncbi:MAG: sensor domain-containing diguanylate cyclase [Colwellia sp.]|nr:sensor domain-containing diguanylate cyclase [Colwellia sp.]